MVRLLPKEAIRFFGREVWYYVLSVVDGNVIVQYKKIRVAGILIINDDTYLIDEKDTNIRLKLCFAFDLLQNVAKYVTLNINTLVAEYVQASSQDE